MEAGKPYDEARVGAGSPSLTQGLTQGELGYPERTGRGAGRGPPARYEPRQGDPRPLSKRENIFRLVTSEHKLKASREGST